jgi:hypothetical protein
MPPELSDDHVAAICRVLIDHEVKFVVIGGMAARLHDTGHATIDVDICPLRDDASLSSLADALRELGARLRVEGDPDGVPFDPHPTLLRDVAMMTLITEEGPLDLCFVPAGFSGGYDSLSKHASVIVVGAVHVPVASLRDVVASKRAAGRPKDIVALPPLEAHLRSRER